MLLNKGEKTYSNPPNKNGSSANPASIGRVAHAHLCGHKQKVARLYGLKGNGYLKWSCDVGPCYKPDRNNDDCVREVTLQLPALGRRFIPALGLALKGLSGQLCFG